MNLRERVRALGYPEAIAKAVEEEGQPFEVFAAYHRHVTEVDTMIGTAESDKINRLLPYRLLIGALIPSVATDTVFTALLKLALLVQAAPVVMFLTIPARMSCWRARRRAQRHLCPNFREWVVRNQGA